MLQCVAEMCSKWRLVRLPCLLGTSCEVSPSAATGGDPRVSKRILGTSSWRKAVNQIKFSVYFSTKFGSLMLVLLGSSICIENLPWQVIALYNDQHRSYPRLAKVATFVALFANMTTGSAQLVYLK